jgi:hypothetical protein
MAEALVEHEAAVLAAVRGALPGLLTVVVEAATSALDAGVATVRQRCPHCGVRVRVDSWRRRQVRTICGPITLTRPWYACPSCGHGFSPVDATLALPPRARLSETLRLWVMRLGATTTFREAADLLVDLTGLVVAPDTVRAQSEQCGAAVAAADEAAIAHVLATQETAAVVDPAPGTLLVEADGVMVHYLDGWHEVKVGLLGGVVDGDLQAPSYVAAREAVDQFGPRLLTEAARRGALEVIGWEGPLGGRHLAHQRPVHVVADGAPWIWHRAADHCGARTEVVDFYHASEHLWEVARALYGAETPEATAWAHARVHELYKHGVDPVRAALTRARAPTAAAGETLRRERGSVATNTARMHYPTIRRQHLPIGSGAVESSGKHVIQQRMKRAGQRWSAAGGRAILALRACTASGRPLPPHAKRLHSSVTGVDPVWWTPGDWGAMPREGSPDAEIEATLSGRVSDRSHRARPGQRQTDRRDRAGPGGVRRDAAAVGAPGGGRCWPGPAGRVNDGGTGGVAAAASGGEDAADGARDPKKWPCPSGAPGRMKMRLYSAPRAGAETAACWCVGSPIKNVVRDAASVP